MNSRPAPPQIIILKPSLTIKIFTQNSDIFFLVITHHSRLAVACCSRCVQNLCDSPDLPIKFHLWPTVDTVSWAVPREVNTWIGLQKADSSVRLDGIVVLINIYDITIQTWGENWNAEIEKIGREIEGQW